MAITAGDMPRRTWRMSEGPWDDAVAMLKRWVRVTQSFEPVAMMEGELLALCDDGEFRLRGEDGMVWYGWPALQIEDLPQRRPRA